MPYSDTFVEALANYSEQIYDAERKNKHHDHRRNLFINFLREGFGLDPVEIELEKKIKAHSVRGRIDAFFRQLIIEVKTSVERERDDAEVELKKYFESQRRPYDFVGLVTDGIRFEVYLYENKQVQRIRAFEIDAQAPRSTFQHLDQIFFTAERLIPTPGDIVDRFGYFSAAFNIVRRTLLEAYSAVNEHSTVGVKFREWNALLSKVYGTDIGDETLFVTHTYLAMVSRAIVTRAVFPKELRNRSMFRGIVNGEFFRRNGLVNLAEPDFFSWALDTEVESMLLDCIGGLFTSLDVYNFNKLENDVLKELYEGLVDPASRHDLGEYYTPDWLAELTLAKLGYKSGRLLDPACGSGSFLYAAARKLRDDSGFSGNKLTSHILESVIGIDVHPVAVLMAKANLLLSLRQEIAKYKKDIHLQIYMADTLMTGEDKEHNNLVITTSDNGESFHIPFETIQRGAAKLDEIVDMLCAFAKRGEVSKEKEEVALKGVRAKLQQVGCSSNELLYWQHNFRLLVSLERSKRNTVWAYILKNSYRPAYLREDKVDYIVGNPPWLAYAFIKNKAYKKRVKDLTFEHGLLSKGDRNLFTRMDTSTLFFVHCQRDFLKPKGTIAFVLPKTAMLPAKQHLKFQEIGFSSILDCSDVRPLFNVRSCVLIRGNKPKVVGVPCVNLSGDFGGERNLTLRDASSILREYQGEHDLALPLKEYSPYHGRFFQGATLVPRSLWFVEPHDASDAESAAPYLLTSEEAHRNAKKPWTMKVEGRVEREFLYGTVLARALLPFAIHEIAPLVLPVACTSNGKLRMVSSEEALADGFVHAYDWFEKAEEVWMANRKSESHTLREWLNYDNKITNQPFQSPFFVLYNQSGTNLSAAVLSQSVTASRCSLPIRGFVVDSKCYWLATNVEEEAHYLVGILNAESINSAIKPYQTQGLQGERDIHRRPFEVCAIPLYNANDPDHVRIAELAKSANRRLAPIVKRMGGRVAQMRAEARSLVVDILAELDERVTRVLKEDVPKRVIRKKASTEQHEMF